MPYVNLLRVYDIKSISGLQEDIVKEMVWLIRCKIQITKIINFRSIHFANDYEDLDNYLICGSWCFRKLQMRY